MSTLAETIPTKVCYKCHVEKPRTLEYFYKSGRYDKDGNYFLKPICKQCHDMERKNSTSHKASSLSWYHRNKEKLKEKRQQKKATEEAQKKE